MNPLSPLMIFGLEEADSHEGLSLASSLGYPDAQIVYGRVEELIVALNRRSIPPRFLIIDIGARGADALGTLDRLAEHCDPTIRVVVVGAINDVHFYRDLKQRGVLEYFTRPVDAGEMRVVLTSPLLSYDGGAAEGEGEVIAVMGAASADGASTVATSVAYALAQGFGQPTVLVDLDYQFGMIAKNLDLNPPFGIRELFEHPERGVDATMVARMLASYGQNLRIIASPAELRLMPAIGPELVRDLVATLRSQFAFVVLDVPHAWTPWTAAALMHATRTIMVAQLWLRSVTHCSRLLSVWGDIGIDRQDVTLVINRSGAKFKEAVSPRDCERVCHKKINFYLANDIRTIAAAENAGKTLFEVGESLLERQIRELARSLLGEQGGKTEKSAAKPPRKHLFGLV